CKRLRHIQLQLAQPQQLIWSTEGCPKLEMPLVVPLQYRVAASLIKKLNGRYISDGLDFRHEDKLTASELSALAEALKSKPPLTSLDLRSNRIGEKGAQALAEALKSKPPLVSLNLWNNHIGDAGAQALAEALKSKPPLTMLILGYNKIGNVGAQAL